MLRFSKIEVTCNIHWNVTVRKKRLAFWCLVEPLRPCASAIVRWNSFRSAQRLVREQLLQDILLPIPGLLAFFFGEKGSVASHEKASKTC